MAFAFGDLGAPARRLRSLEKGFQNVVLDDGSHL
jgi:hypothetical protein